MKNFAKRMLLISLVHFLLYLAIPTSLYSQISAEKTQDYLEQIVLGNSVPGISAAVLLNGEIIFSGGAGYADLENYVPATGSTVYRIASISKPIAAIGLMKLVQEGKVDLKKIIQTYVPEMPKKKWDINLLQILTHTSGIRHYNDGEFGKMQYFPDFTSAIAIFKDDPLKFKPGTRFSYSTYASNLMQGVIESVSGEDFEDYLRKNVWLKAGMLSTSFEVKERLVHHRAKGYRKVEGKIINAPYTDVSIKYAGGGMISTVEDLVQLFNALDSGKLLNAETVAEMYKVHFPMGTNGGGRGLSWSVANHPELGKLISHSGGATGFRSMLYNNPENGLVVAVITNQDFMSVGGVAMNILNQYFSEMK